jgi:hypothetical protein
MVYHVCFIHLELMALLFLFAFLLDLRSLLLSDWPCLCTDHETYASLVLAMIKVQDHWWRNHLYFRLGTLFNPDFPTKSKDPGLKIDIFNPG